MAEEKRDGKEITEENAAQDDPPAAEQNSPGAEARDGQVAAEQNGDDAAGQNSNGAEEQNVQDAELAKKRRHRRRMKALRSLLIRTLALALVIYILLFHIVGIAIMPSGDMYPRLDAGDLLLYYRIERNIKAQDIVVIDKAVNTDYSAVQTEARPDPGFIRKALNWLGFKDPDAPATHRFVCRVVACAGDTVDISDERGLTVNGNSVVETNIFYPTRPYEGYGEYPVKLAEGEYFVLADLRNGGADSRFFGPVKTEEIQGVLITLLRRNNM